MSSADQRFWSLQLIKDYDDILFQYRLKLKRPIIEVIDSKSFWGRWDPLYKKIEVSKSLIINHEWDVVLNILKHEVAHQIVSEKFQSDDSGHGELFLKACDLLGLPLEYRSASGDLPRELKHWKDESAKQDEIIQRIEKLFALAQSDNEHEASIAIKKAQELMSRYNLSGTAKKQDYVYLIINTHRKKMHSYESRIGSLLMNYYFVDVVLSELYNAQKNEVHKTLEIMGTKQNVLIAEYVYHYLLTALEHLWTNYKNGTGATFQHKRSYLLGLLSGFEKKLIESETLVLTEHSKALMKVRNQQLKEFVGERFPRLHKKSSGRGRYNYGAYRSGQSDGRKITIKKGVGSPITKFLAGR